MLKCILIPFFMLFAGISGGDVKPNVLLIMLDDFRGGIGALGDELARTPNMDLLAKRSYSFSNVYASQALCAPSRNSMLTSRRPDTILTYNFNHYWRSFVGNFTTLPQYFKENGYRTESIGKIFHHGPSSNKTDDYPYSWSNPTFIPSSQEYRNKPVCVSEDGDMRRNLLCPVNVNAQPESTLPDIQSAEKAREFLSQQHDEPFFLGLGFYKPHIPLKFPIEYLARHDINNFKKDYLRPIDIPDVAWNPYNDLRERDDFKALNVSFPFGPIPSEFAAKLRQHYYASVSYVDDLLGGVLQLVNFSNTIVILTSDHSWSLGEHSEWSKYSNYEVSLKVPLIIYDPKAPQPKMKNIDSIVELIDLFPTIVDIAGLPGIDKCSSSSLDYEEENITCTEGKSLHKLMLSPNGNANNEFAFSQYPRPGNFPTKSPDSDQPKLREIKIMGYSIRSRQFRYTAWIKFNNKKFKRSKFSTSFTNDHLALMESVLQIGAKSMAKNCTIIASMLMKT